MENTDLAFLALVCWREARGEPFLGKVAVVHSILNRVKRPCWWGDTVLNVVGKREQYSALTHPGDANLIKWPRSEDPSWQECLKAAELVLAGAIPNPVPGADSYWDISIPAPYWATPENFVASIGKLRFHDVDQDHEVVG